MAILTKPEQKKINKAVDTILLQTNKSYPKDSLLNIVKALNIQVKTANFGKYNDKVSGVIQRNPPIIYLNETDSKERKTFTLAHELGHYLLHKGTKFRVDKYNYQANTPEAKEETEANFFAACLLMPEDEFLGILNKAEGTAEIAKYFGVSESAVSNRIRWLKQN